MSAMPSSVPDRAARLGRRGFLVVATRALLWLTGGAAAIGLGRYLSYEPPAAGAQRFTLEPIEAYPAGIRVVVAQASAAVYRDAAGLYARSLTCGHLGCRVHTSDDGGFACPCHGSQFTRDGARRAGPAPRDLDGLALNLDEQGRLVLDKAARVGPGWRLTLGTGVGRLPGGTTGASTARRTSSCPLPAEPRPELVEGCGEDPSADYPLHASTGSACGEDGAFGAS